MDRVYGMVALTLLSLIFGVSSQTTPQYENILISQNKPVSMSSTLNYTGLWEAHRAVDGDLRQNADGCTCCAGTKEVAGSTFTLNLGDAYRISHINILGRTDHINAPLSHVKLYLSNTNNTQDGVEVHTIVNIQGENFAVNKTVAYQYVIAKSDLKGYLIICEIQVYTPDGNYTTVSPDATCLHVDPASTKTEHCSRKCCLKILEECSKGYFGENCVEKCNCADQAECDKKNGTCSNGRCTFGYIGHSCSKVCSHAQFGQNCTNTCHCYNNTSCDHVTGECESKVCAPGWNGSSCSDECSHAQFGQNCTNTCHCYNNTSCNHVTGECENEVCAPGWNGSSCSDECSHAQFGQNCTNTCHCYNNTSCDHVTGECENEVCAPGWNGSSCSDECSHAQFGQNCTNTCHCYKNTSCDHVTGECENDVCAPGWNGSSCSDECSHAQFGQNCTNTCHCYKNTSCDHVTGECENDVCAPGWNGSSCSDECSHAQFGQNCTNTCHCYNNTSCDHVTGECENEVCAPGWNGSSCSDECSHAQYGQNCTTTCHCYNNTSCDHVSGECENDVCAPGWNGSSCSDECSHAQFGQNCTNTCHCYKNTSCDHVTGECENDVCAPGWNGSSCSDECSHAQFGQNCTNTCHCYNNTSCDHVTGECENEVCAPGWNGSSCSDECSHAQYGQNCTTTCHCYNNTSCDHVSGECENDVCAPGWNGSSCSDECSHAQFGQNCTNTCHCYKNTSCDHVTGECENDVCAPGWNGSSCSDECSHAQFGQNCTNTCHCYNNTSCDHVSGECENEVCAPGWNGSSCSDECSHAQYGQNCTTTCHCYNNTSCDHVSGECENDVCAPGWNGSSCSDECSHAQFGQNCTNTCHCYNNTSCDHVTGECENDVCAPGWNSSSCSDECSHAQFGQNCTNTCHCYNNTSCDHVTGQCENEVCAPGWNGSSCSDECSHAQFGQNCTNTCHCYNNTSCEHVTGECENEVCASGWNGSSCSDECAERRYGQGCSESCHCKDDVTCDRFTGHCPDNFCARGWWGQNCEKECGNNTFGENCTETCNCADVCNHVDGVCLLSSGCKSGWQGETCSERIVAKDDGGPNVGAIAGGLVAALVAIAVIVAGGFFVIRRRKADDSPGRKPDVDDRVSNANNGVRRTTQRKADSFDSLSRNANPMKNINNAEHNGNQGSIYYNVGDVDSGVKVHELWNYIKLKSMNNNQEFAEEYASVPKNAGKSTNAALFQQNRSKNRYKEIKAFDENRVHLSIGNGNDGDYINASFIDGSEMPKKFIASQGPQEVMVDDFWRMVWEQKSEKIVMLTNIYENDVRKVVCYWSDEGDVTFGKLAVKVENTEGSDDYIIRKMKIAHENGGSHTVTQYHFVSWPDKDVPSTAWSLVNFWRKVNETKQSKQSGPIVVHCSAGVGRTGTFVALDYLYNEAVISATIRPLRALQRLRDQRACMVQTQAQYVYLHEAVAEALYVGTHHVTEAQFEHIYDFMTGQDERTRRMPLEIQFETLTKSLDQPMAGEKNAVTEPEYGNVQTAQLEFNAYRPRSKNRNSKSIQELGAIYLPTFGGGNGFIISKIPSESLVCGFWNLINEENVKTVVMVSDRTKGGKVPPNLGASSNALEGRYVVTSTLDKTTNGTVERTFGLKEAGTRASTESTVRLFNYTAWKEGYQVPGDVSSVQNLLESVVNWHAHPSESQPILVCCGTGVAKSGVLCVLLNEMYRMRKENGNINIIESVKTMKHRQRQIVNDFTQYKFCYEAINEICKQNSPGEHLHNVDNSYEDEQLYQNL